MDVFALSVHKQVHTVHTVIQLLVCRGKYSHNWHCAATSVVSEARTVSIQRKPWLRSSTSFFSSHTNAGEYSCSNNLPNIVFSRVFSVSQTRTLVSRVALLTIELPGGGVMNARHNSCYNSCCYEVSRVCYPAQCRSVTHPLSHFGGFWHHHCSQVLMRGLSEGPIVGLQQNIGVRGIGGWRDGGMDS